MRKTSPWLAHEGKLLAHPLRRVGRRRARLGASGVAVAAPCHFSNARPREANHQEGTSRGLDELGSEQKKPANVPVPRRLVGHVRADGAGARVQRRLPDQRVDEAVLEAAELWRARADARAAEPRPGVRERSAPAAHAGAWHHSAHARRAPPPAAHASWWWRGHASSSSSPPDAQPEPAAPSSRRWVRWRIADASSPAWAAASCVPAEPASSGRARAPAASSRDP